MNFSTFFPIQNEKFRAFLIVLGVILIIIFGQRSSNIFINSTAKEILAPLAVADSLQNITFDLMNKKSSPIQILKNQYEICQNIKSYYKEISVLYYSNYYAFSICSIIFTTLLTIAVFLIANKGWQNTGLLLKTFLLSTFVAATIYYFLPNVLTNKDNFQKNIEKISTFEIIQCDIMSFSNGLERVSPKQIDSVIKSNYKRIGENYKFITDIDNSKISNPAESFKAIK